MLTIKQLELEQKAALEQQQVLAELQSLARDIGRGERSIISLKAELDAVNARFQGPRNTREDISYLSALLQCARKKLAWEKQMGSLQKRTPELLERVTRCMNHPDCPPSDPVRAEMHSALQAVQTALQALDAAKAGLN